MQVERGDDRRQLEPVAAATAVAPVAATVPSVPSAASSGASDDWESF